MKFTPDNNICVIIKHFLKITLKLCRIKFQICINKCNILSFSLRHARYYGITFTSVLIRSDKPYSFVFSYRS